MPDSPTLHTLRVPRTARVATFGTPATAPIWWVVLHGYGQLATGFIENFASLVTPNRCVVAPEGLSRFYVDGMDENERVGASWMTRETREAEIEDYVRALDTTIRHLSEGGPPPSLCVLGFSQGAATASRWALLGETAVDRLVLWGGALAHDLDLADHAAALRNLDLTLVAGRNDPHVPLSRRRAIEERIRQYDIPVTVHTFDGRHRLDEATLCTLAQAS